MTLMNGQSSSPRGITLSPNRSSIISVLDIGTTKICCVIAKLRPLARRNELPGRTHGIEVLGVSHQISRGIKGGVVIDMDMAEQSIRAAVDAAERMAGLTVDSVVLNISCGRIYSEAFSASIDIRGHEVCDRDIQRVLQAGRKHSDTQSRSVLHALPIGYTLDGNRGIRDPRGMLGESLGVDIHMVSSETAPLRNLSLCISRCHLTIEAMVTTPYASGLSSLVQDETDLGVLCIDMGGGTTSASIFFEGNFVYSDVIAVGGGHVTTDIARGLSTPMNEAERIKTLFGSALASESDERETIQVPSVGDSGEEGGHVIPRSMLTGMIQPRIEEIFEMLRDRLRDSGFNRYAGRQVVLTGGASQLTGVREIAVRILDKQVRIGRPLGVTGLPEATRGPSFTAAMGLLVYPQVALYEVAEIAQATRNRTMGTGYLARVGGWLKESF